MTRRAAVLLAAVLAAPVAAQNTYKPGRTPDGHPDLTGIWEMRGTANWNLEVIMEVLAFRRPRASSLTNRMGRFHTTPRLL